MSGRHWLRVTLALTYGTAHLGAQMHMPGTLPTSASPLDIPETREGSGTSWLPDASPMRAAHLMLGAWTVMLHGAAFLQSDWQGGARGASQVGVVNWVMAAASRPLSGGRLHVRTMLSAEPWTIGSRGYPLLAQTGESYEGAALHDRQHPHDLFMELATLYERPVARDVAASLYLAPVGEPALGPVAFPHRPSAADDPLAPIAHHWQDGTHVTFGVITAGVFTRAVKLEGSWFNGREPDADRTDFDYRGRRLDSFSGRVTVNPAARWSFSAWYAYLRSPEGLDPSESLHRSGAAVLTSQPTPGGACAGALIYGANDAVGVARPAPGVVLEASCDVDAREAVFGRLEYVRKSALDLVIASAPPSTTYPIEVLALGYLRTLGRLGGLDAGAGVRASLTFVPAAIAAPYGGRTPPGIAVYLRLRPRALSAGSMP